MSCVFRNLPRPLVIKDANAVEAQRVLKEFNRLVNLPTQFALLCFLWNMDAYIQDSIPDPGSFFSLQASLACLRFS